MPDLFTIAFTFLGIFILFIVYKKDKRVSDYTLILLNVISGIGLYVSLHATPEMPPLSFFLHLIIANLGMSIFMVYASQLITGQSWQRYYWLFFASFSPMALYLFYDVFWAHANFIALQKEYFYNPPFLYHIFFKGNKVYAILLCLYLLKQLKEYSLSIENNFSCIEKIRLEWLKHYVFGLILIFTVSLFVFLFYNAGWIVRIESAYVVLNTLIIIALFYLSFHGIRYQNLEAFYLRAVAMDTAQVPQVFKVGIAPAKKIAVKSQGSLEIYEEVLKIFSETQLFTQRQLRVSDLAVRLDIPSYQLSQIINAYHGRPFYDFVASYRVN